MQIPTTKSAASHANAWYLNWILFIGKIHWNWVNFPIHKYSMVFEGDSERENGRDGESKNGSARE